MQLFVFLFDIYAIRAVYYHKLRRIIKIFKQQSVLIMLFLTLWIFAKIVCLFLQKPRVPAAKKCLFLQCRCCEAAENAFETLKWLAELMILAVNRILTRRSIITWEIEVEKKKEKKKKIRKNFEFWNSKDFWNSMNLQSPKGFAEFKRICKIQKDLQNSKRFAEFERICKIQKDLRNSKRFAEFKKICKKFFVYKLIFFFTRKKANRK